MLVLSYQFLWIWSYRTSPFLCLLRIKYWLLTALGEGFWCSCNHLHHVCTNASAHTCWIWFSWLFLWLQHLKYLPSKPLDNCPHKSYNTTPPNARIPQETDHMLWPQLPYKKLSAPLMLDHIKLGADFMTTCLTTFRTGLPGNSSTRQTSYLFFRKKARIGRYITQKTIPCRLHQCISFK